MTTSVVNNNVTLCDATAGAFSVYLNAAAVSTGPLHFKKTDSSTNAVTIDADGAEEIDGSTTFVLADQYDTVSLVCDGSAWYAIEPARLGVAEVAAVAPTPTRVGMLWLDTSASPATFPTYAGIYAVSNAVETAIAVAGTAVQVTIFGTNSPALGLTPDHTNDHVTVDRDGVYFIAVSATINSVAGLGSKFEMTVQKNNGASDVAGLHCDRNIAGGGGVAGVISMSGLATLAAADTIEVWIENESNTANYVVEDIDLTVMRVNA